MTDTNFDDGNCLVRVRAQVMTRDDSTGGWVPMGGGGLSNVSVRKRLIPNEDDTKHEYLIYGKRISDSCVAGSVEKVHFSGQGGHPYDLFCLGSATNESQNLYQEAYNLGRTERKVVLSCPIRKDFQYNKVMPTFHHWRTGDKKFGLTFQTAADARAFDKGVRRAVEDLLEGTGELPHFHDADIGDDDVFMTLELPVDSRSSSGSSSASGTGMRPSSTTPTIPSDLYTSSPYTHPHANHHHLHRMHFIRSSRQPAGASDRRDEVWVKDRFPGNKKEPPENDKIEILSGEPYSYVQFAKDKPRTEHEYSYPIMDSLKMGKCGDSLKKQHQVQTICQQPPLLPTKCKRKKDKQKNRRHSASTRAQCRHCLEMFGEEENCRGSCEYAPDKVLACINAATCISCAQCMLYHCMADTEGDFNQHPCSCDGADEHCHRRWVGLALLSIFVPCLWCYLPLRACHGCGVGCRMCGGKHEAA